jgi:hypothetical protein
MAAVGSPGNTMEVFSENELLKELIDLIKYSKYKNDKSLSKFKSDLTAICTSAEANKHIYTSRSLGYRFMSSATPKITDSPLNLYDDTRRFLEILCLEKDKITHDNIIIIDNLFQQILKSSYIGDIRPISEVKFSKFGRKDEIALYLNKLKDNFKQLQIIFLGAPKSREFVSSLSNKEKSNIMLKIKWEKMSVIDKGKLLYNIFKDELKKVEMTNSVLLSYLKIDKTILGNITISLANQGIVIPKNSASALAKFQEGTGTIETFVQLLASLENAFIEKYGLKPYSQSINFLITSGILPPGIIISIALEDRIKNLMETAGGRRTRTRTRNHQKTVKKRRYH